jgi:hypothetical protein
MIYSCLELENCSFQITYAGRGIQVVIECQRLIECDVIFVSGSKLTGVPVMNAGSETTTS